MHSALLAVFSCRRSLGSDIEAVSHPIDPRERFRGAISRMRTGQPKGVLGAVRVSQQQQATKLHRMSHGAAVYCELFGSFQR
jgi:hypothetical protein